MKKIGIVGLGIMGSGIADNFLKKGYQVFVWNRTKLKLKELIKKGEVECSAPSEVSRKADIIFEVTANDESSRFVWRGKNGIISGADKYKILIACTTLSIGWIEELIRECKKVRATFLDIGLTGGRIGAESGSLTLLCGGKKEVLEKITSVLKSISKKIFYFGPEGQGMRYKLILNFLQAVHIIGFGQALKIAKANKMNLKLVGDALVDKPGGMTTAFTWRDYQKEPDPINFSIGWITKDLTYAKKLAKNLKVSMLDEVLLIYKKARRKGFAQKDWVRINNLLNEENG